MRTICARVHCFLISLERARIDKLNEDHNNRLLLMPVTKKRKKENDTTSNDDRIYATDPRFRAYSPVYD